MDSSKPPWGPPVSVSQQRHERRYEERPHDGRIDQHRKRRADAKFLDEDDVRSRERANRDGEQQGRRRDDSPGPLDAECDDFPVGGTGITGFLDPREQEDA